MDPPPEVVRCRRCLAECRPGQLRCWDCRRLLAGPGAPGAPTARRLGIGSAMIGIALLGVTFGAIRLAPGLGIPMLLILAPATTRAHLAIARRSAAEWPIKPWERFDLIVGSLYVVLATIVAAGIAFVATCVPLGCLFAETLARSGTALLAAVLGGLVSAGVVVFVLALTIWPIED